MYIPNDWGSIVWECVGPALFHGLFSGTPPPPVWLSKLIKILKLPAYLPVTLPNWE